MASGILQQPIRAAIYARVSTTNHGQDVSMQTEEVQPFAEARGWSFVSPSTWTRESAEQKTGGLLWMGSCPMLTREKFDVVVCWRFDRFARSVSHLLRALETFNALGIAFVNLSENARHRAAEAERMIGTVLRGRGRVRALSDCGACPGRSAECPRKGEEAGEAASGCGLRQGCQFARVRAFLAGCR